MSHVHHYILDVFVTTDDDTLPSDEQLKEALQERVDEPGIHLTLDHCSTREEDDA